MINGEMKKITIEMINKWVDDNVDYYDPADYPECGFEQCVSAMLRNFKLEHRKDFSDMSPELVQHLVSRFELAWTEIYADPNLKFFDRTLPKWSGLLVLGEPVSPERAAEILVRTDALQFWSNDREFDADLNEIVYGLRVSGNRFYEAALKTWGEMNLGQMWERLDRIDRELGQVELNYLRNARIVSTWVGGPHGWCNWDGTVRAANYNIGKKPTVREVYDDWVSIARTFPDLKLRSQLLAGGDIAGALPVVEFVVDSGRVEMVEPVCRLMDPEPIDFMPFDDPLRERGCTLEQFRWAHDLVRSKLGRRSTNNQ